MYVSWVFADKLRMVMSSSMRWRSGEIGLVIGETPVSGLHKTCNPCRQATAYRCPHFDRVDRQAMTITATSDNQILKSNIRNWAIGLQTFTTGSLPRSGLVQRGLWNIPAAVQQSLGLRAGELDDLPPLLGIVSDELAEVGGRARKDRATQVGKPRFQPRRGEACIDLRIEFRDDLGRRVLRRAEANPLTRLETRHEITECRDIRQRL